MTRALRLAVSLALAISCDSGDAGTAPGSLMQGAAAGRVERERLLGPFLASHWELPVAPQGPPPPGWSPLESSLEPESCGACHPRQLAEWSTSLHAGAFSPGFAGQIVDGPIREPATVRLCQTCHTPLAEQLPFDAALVANPAFDPQLREQGIVCAACHVRAHRRYGPPRRAEAPPAPEPLPHGGFEARAEYQQARFCATCHQFFDVPGVNGKPIENTFAEWRASPHAAEGRTCQSCHMPDRQHLWRGIHHPETVRAAVEVDLVDLDLDGDELGASLVLRSRDVGHHFPSYVTPRVFLAIWQADAAGEELADTRQEATLGREIDLASRREVFDTRVAAGESARLEYARRRASAASALVGRVTVDPDFHYRGVFDDLRRQVHSPSARARLEEAYRRTSESVYVLTEIRRPLPVR